MNAELHKQWLNLTLADNFLFQKYMQNVENCKKLISEICGREVERIEYKNTEQSIEEGIGSKGIRLDVYFIGDNKVYNFEMQNRDEDLPKRNRYYHSMIDLKTLEKGGDYEDLKDVYVIFICTFDPFGKDCYIYKIKNQCTNVEDLEYEDGNHTIFLNTKGQYGEISDYLKAFLMAVDGKFDSSEFSSQIRKDIDFLKTNENLEGKYMNYAEIIRDAKKEGIREGREYGTRMTKIKVIKMLLEKMDIEEIIELGFDEELVKKLQKSKMISREEVEKVKANSVWREEYMFQEMHDIEMKEEGKLEAIKTLLNTKSIEEVIALGFDEELVKKAAEKQDD